MQLTEIQPQTQSFHDLVVVTDNSKLMTNSRIVAAAFGRQHKNLLRVIDEMRSSKNPEIAEHARLNFEPSIFEVRGGKRSVRKVGGYTMTRDGFSELVMSFTGDQARVIRIRFIAAFNAMAEHIASAEKNLWQKMQELISKEVGSQVKASFGSHLMLDRKKELPSLRIERLELESQIQPSLELA